MHDTSPEPTVAKPTIIERILGNATDEAWRKKLAVATVDQLRLDQWQAQKNRLRKATEAGV